MDWYWWVLIVLLVLGVLAYFVNSRRNKTTDYTRS